VLRDGAVVADELVASHVVMHEAQP
jgi:hypothetical protein